MPITDLAQTRREQIIQDVAETEDKLNENVAFTIIQQLPVFADVLEFNVDTQEMQLQQAIVLNDNVSLEAGTLDDNAIIGILMFFQANGYPTAKEPTIRAALVRQARKHPVSSFTPFLKDAEKSGTVRPDIYRDLMVTKLGAEDEPYSVFWLKSLLSAIYKHQTYKEGGEPFSRVPYRYFMFGAQGIGKSFALTRISNGLEVSFDGDLNNKDVKKNMAGAVIVNADDTATQQTKLVDEIKSAITTPYYKIRLPYAKGETNMRNKGVFVGSTNRHQAYTDTTGDRREMPIDLNVAMDEHTAELHGKKWVQDLVTNDKDYFKDLWCTFLHDYKATGYDPSPYTHEGMDERRHEVISGHRRESDLTFIIGELLGKSVPVDFAEMDTDQMREALGTDLATDIDPFTGVSRGTCLLSDLPSIPATVIVKEIKKDYEGKVSRATIVEAMRDHGYKEVKSKSRTFDKIVK